MTSVFEGLPFPLLGDNSASDTHRPPVPSRDLGSWFYCEIVKVISIYLRWFTVFFTLFC